MKMHLPGLWREPDSGCSSFGSPGGEVAADRPSRGGGGEAEVGGRGVGEAAERAQEEEAWAQEYAVALAEARLKETCTEFVAETYTPPEPHIFVPSGVDSYVPRQEHYDP